MKYRLIGGRIPEYSNNKAQIIKWANEYLTSRYVENVETGEIIYKNKVMRDRERRANTLQQIGDAARSGKLVIVKGA